MNLMAMFSSVSCFILPASFFTAQRLHDFDIHISCTAMNQEMTTPNFSSLPLCTHHSCLLDGGEEISLSCDKGNRIGRYLLVNIEGESEILSLAEVKVQGGNAIFFYKS